MNQAETAPLVARARSGEEAAWREIVDRYGPLLTWVVRRHRLPPHDAADVIQATWLRCVEHLADLRDPQQLASWLATTCRRESLRVLRQQGRCLPQDTTTATSSICAVHDPAGDPYDQVARKDDAALLYAALDDLPHRQRQLLIELMHRHDDGYAAASQRLGLPVGSIGPTRRRALDRLRQDRRLQVTL